MANQNTRFASDNEAKWHNTDDPFDVRLDYERVTCPHLIGRSRCARNVNWIERGQYEGQRTPPGCACFQAAVVGMGESFQA